MFYVSAEFVPNCKYYARNYIILTSHNNKPEKL